jgi:hypothetical protein
MITSTLLCALFSFSAKPAVNRYKAERHSDDGSPLSGKNLHASCGKLKRSSSQRKLGSSDLQSVKGTGFQLSLE